MTPIWSNLRDFGPKEVIPSKYTRTASGLGPSINGKLGFHVQTLYTSCV